GETLEAPIFALGHLAALGFDDPDELLGQRFHLGGGHVLTSNKNILVERHLSDGSLWLLHGPVLGLGNAALFRAKLCGHISVPGLADPTRRSACLRQQKLPATEIGRG